jgi:hypothetical protein
VQNQAHYYCLSVFSRFFSEARFSPKLGVVGVSLISPGWGAITHFSGSIVLCHRGAWLIRFSVTRLETSQALRFRRSSPPSCISGCGEIVQSLGASRHYAIGSGCSDGRIAGAIAVESSPPPRLQVGPRPRRADAKRQLQPSKTPSKPKLREHYFCSGRVVVSV